MSDIPSSALSLSGKDMKKVGGGRAGLGVAQHNREVLAAEIRVNKLILARCRRHNQDKSNHYAGLDSVPQSSTWAVDLL